MIKMRDIANIVLGVVFDYLLFVLAFTFPILAVSYVGEFPVYTVFQWAFYAITAAVSLKFTVNYFKV